MPVDPLVVAVAAAHEAGAVLLRRARGPGSVTEKGRRGDLVTDADRAAECFTARRGAGGLISILATNGRIQEEMELIFSSSG
jgi:fructose-1,6-bisphosphatase/inositol monophosphatase family enzyme